MSRSKVLLVEDSKINTLVIQQHLRSSGHFSVSWVETLGDACSVLGNGDKFDVAILNLN